VGVDAHAAHSYAVVVASTGALVDEATVRTSAAGIGRACGWIDRRSGGDRSAVLVAAEGTGSYGAVLSHVLAGRGYRVVEAPAAKRDRGSHKTDALDAWRAARSIPGMSLEHLVDRRAGALHAAVAVLVTSRDPSTQRVRSINTLTALVRNHDLSLDARRALSHTDLHDRRLAPA